MKKCKCKPCKEQKITITTKVIYTDKITEDMITEREEGYKPRWFQLKEPTEKSAFRKAIDEAPVYWGQIDEDGNLTWIGDPPPNSD